MKWRRLLSGLIYALTSLVGLLAFIYPLFIPMLAEPEAVAPPQSPLLMTFIVSACFVILLLEVQGNAVDTKFVALLGVLVALNAVLRFVETAIPGPGGFSPIFFLILTTGYVFGARFGFLMGALTLLVSALVTGGIGPWLPYQMFVAGWVGLSAALFRWPARWWHWAGRRVEVVVLTALGGMWGLLFGVLMNLSFWAYSAAPAAQSGVADGTALSLWESLQHYFVFYAASSLVWDVVRALGNVVLLLLFAAPTLRALRRFRRRFAFTYQPADIPEGVLDGC